MVASKDEEPEQEGSAAAHEESEHEDLYGVSDKEESAEAHDNRAQWSPEQRRRDASEVVSAFPGLIGERHE